MSILCNLWGCDSPADNRKVDNGMLNELLKTVRPLPTRYCPRCGHSTQAHIEGKVGGYDVSTGQPWYRLTAHYRCDKHRWVGSFVITTPNGDGWWSSVSLGAPFG